MGLFPYFHPTSIIVVDDDKRFLDSFAFYFGDFFTCHAFSRPEQAVAFIESQEQFRTSPEHFISSAEHEAGTSFVQNGNALVQVQASRVSQLSSDENRFRQLTVAVVDYAMPEMTGVELCRRLHGLPIKKILLTGKVGEGVAVKAFNEGTIDSFLMKQQKDLPAVLRREIRELQESYFSDTTRPINVVLSRDSLGFLKDAVFRDYFLELSKARGIVEHYVHASPPGVVVVDEDGNSNFLAVADDDLMRTHLEIAIAEHAPAELIQLLERQSIIPVFPTPRGYYSPDHADDWRSHVWPARPVNGTRRWLVAMTQKGGIAARDLISYARFCAGDSSPARA